MYLNIGFLWDTKKHFWNITNNTKSEKDEKRYVTNTNTIIWLMFPMWCLRYNYFNHSASFKTHMYWYMYSILISVNRKGCLDWNNPEWFHFITLECPWTSLIWLAHNKVESRFFRKQLIYFHCNYVHCINYTMFILCSRKNAHPITQRRISVTSQT